MPLLEAELSQLETEERQEFMDDLGLKESGLNRVIYAGYNLLGLQTFYGRTQGGSSLDCQTQCHCASRRGPYPH